MCCFKVGRKVLPVRNLPGTFSKNLTLTNQMLSRAASRYASSVSTPAKRAKLAKSSKRKPSFRIPRSVGRSTTVGFPKQLTMKHRYVQVVNMQWAGTNLPYYYIWSTNGMYDPDITGVGHQPMYFDQLTAIYNHYTVHSSKITVDFTCQAATGNLLATTCGIYIEDDTTVNPANVGDFCEQSSAVYGQCLPPTANVLRITKKWSAKQAFGGNTMDNDNLQGTVSANPFEQQAFIVFARGNDNSMIAQAITAHVTIEYTATWDELKNIGGS